MTERTTKTRIAKPTLAFFDFDNTLISDDSQGLEIRSLIERKRIRTIDLARIAIVHWSYKRHLASSDRMVRACIQIYRGLAPREVEKRNHNLYQSHLKPRLMDKAVRRLKTHQRQGDIVAILSASVAHLIEPAAAELGVEHLICTRLETDPAGKLTGKPLGPVCVGAEKTRRAKALAKELGADLSRAWAYSDHHADLDFLSAVGHPVAVNPTPKLRRFAQNNRWQILMTTP